MCLAIHADPHEPLFTRLVEELPKLTLASPHEGSRDLRALPVAEGQEALHDLRRRLSDDRLPARRAVRRADPGPQQAEIVVDLGDGSDGRARVAADRLLLDRDRGRKALDRVDVRLLHEAEELSRVRRQGLHVPALTFGVDRVERQRGLSGPRQPGDHDEPLPGEGHVDVLEVVLPGAPYDEELVGHRRGRGGSLSRHSQVR